MAVTAMYSLALFASSTLAAPIAIPERAARMLQGSIALGETRTGTTTGHASNLGGVSPDHTYIFEVTTAGVFVFNSCGSSYDTWLRIYDAAGNQVASGDDDGGCGIHTILTSPTLPVGSYTLLVEGYSSRSGAYTVTMSNPAMNHAQLAAASAQGAISCDQPVTGNTAGGSSVLGGRSPDHTYQFEVGSPGVFVFNSCGSSYDTWLRIYDFSGNQVASGDDDGDCGVHTILTSPTLPVGSYTLLVEGYSTRSGAYTVTMTGDCVVAPPLTFYKVNTQSKTTDGDGDAQGDALPGPPAAGFAFPITPAVIDQLSADSDAVSMRAFGYQQLEGTSWSDVCAWITPIAAPTHAGSIGADAVAFWGEFEQVVDLQVIRKQSGTAPMARDYLESLPSMFADHTVSAAADEVEKDFPTKFPTMLVEKFLGAGVTFDATIVPHTGDDFVNKVVMLADIIGWAVSVVSPTAFASKWQNGRARPEEVAWAVHEADTHVAGASAVVVTKIRALGLGSPYDFTQYANGSPKHPSWPAMHSAASSASLYLAVLLNLNTSQLAEAQDLDCAVASFRTLAGVHYESDNMAGLSVGQEVIRRKLPGYLADRYGSDPDVVTAKINNVIAAHDWRTAESCFKPQADWPTL